MLDKYSIEQLVNIYFSICGEYETCTSFSAFMAICHKLFHSESEKFQHMWNSLTDEHKKKMDLVKIKINDIIDKRYYNKDKVLSGIRHYDSKKDYITIDMGFLNIINKLYSTKYGIQQELICNSGTLSKYDCDYLHKHNIHTKDDLLNIVNKEAFDGYRFYLLYNSRILPIFSENPNIKYKDILDNIWPFNEIKHFRFYGWKNNIPIIQIN